MLSENYRSIGKFTKLHGYNGEVILCSEGIFQKKIEKTEWVFLYLDGLPVPFFVSSFYLRTDTTAIIKLEDIDSSDEMQKYVGLEVNIIDLAPTSRKKRKSNSLEVEGYKVLDKTYGEIGVAKTVINYSKNFLLQVFKGETEILIPVQEEIILDIDDKSKTIHVNIPEGLLDINL